MYEIFRKPQSVYNIFSANEKTANRNERKALTERIAFYDAVLDILNHKSAESASAAEETEVAEPQTEVETTTETTTETTSFTPGLVEDEYTAKLSGKRRKALHDVAVALGLRVRFVDAVRTAAGGLANADISGNEVRIAWSKRDKAISFLVGHEFTHRMQELSPKEYASFKESVKAYMGEERWNALVAKTRSIYEAHNAREMARAEAEHRAPRLLQYSVELIEDEVVADFAGELNEDANALAAFAEKLAEKPSTLKAVIAVLRDILNKLKGLVAGAEAQRLANMLSKFEELYRASASRTTEGQPQSKEKYALQTFERVTDYITYEARALGITTPIFVVENVEEFKQAMREIGVNNVDDYEKVSGVYDPDNDAIYIRADVSEYERVFFEVLLHENTHAVTASIKGKLKDVLSTLNEVDILAYRDSKLSAIYKNTSALDVLNEIISYFVQEIPQDRLIDYYQGEVDIEDTILSDFEISLIEDEAEQKFIAALRPVILDNLEIQKRNYNERKGKAIVIARGYMGPYGAEIKKSQSSSTNTEHERGNDPRGESEATRGVPQEMGTPSHQDLEHRYSLGADDVFFDDNGDVIPLSERFNPRKEDIRYSLMRPTDKEVTFDNFFANTSAVFTLLHKSEAPQREADYESEHWDGLGISSRYWYGEDERGKYVVRASDHWSDYPRGANSRKAFEDNPYHRRYTRIASSRWALDMADAPNVATPRPEPRASQEEWGAYNEAQKAQRAAFEDAYIDGKAMYGKAYLDDFTKWEVEPRYSMPSQPIFYSNAEYAVRGIKQEKATPEQWLKMIEKNGGLKAGEDKWLGLSDWLKASDKKTLTKDEVLQYIAENDIQIEEVEYAQFGPGLIDEATRKLEAEMREIGIEAMREKYDGFDDLFEVYNGELLWSEERASEGEYEDFIIENNIVDVNAQANAINETRLGYTTNGLVNKREIALTVPTIEPWNTSDNIHFGDAGEGRAVAWIRFGAATDADGKRVLVIDEIQSKRHQEGRDKGYSDKRVSQQELYDAQEEAFSKVIAYESALADKYGEDEWASLASEGEMAEYERLRAIDEAATNAYENYDKGIPSAPFEKNWAELAMKRMLRYAAENGFDKVAWTTGDQQAERYGMHKAVSKIVRRDNSLVEGKRFLLVGDTVVPHKITVSDEGIIVASTIENIEGKALSEVMGKEVALKMMQMGNEATLESANLRIGGEGMKAFYDQMLPSFVRKYAKKWGATVGEVTMPDLEKNNTMHSVDVTPAMRESVMQGQPKFSLRDAETEKIFTAAKEKFGTTYDMREAGYILPDGSMLDFSGKHQVRDADTSFLNGRRTVDHREIEDIDYDFDENETGVKTDLGDFLDRGAIRIDYNAGAINLNIAPTRAQKDRLKRLIERNDGYVYIDFGKGWDTEHYAEYEAARASRVLGDIDRYVDEGIKPTGNVRFSLSEVNDRFNKELATLTEENKDKVNLSLGMPSDILLAAGVVNKPMKLYGAKVIKKQKAHGFKLSELENLPMAVAYPIAVFDNYQKDDNRSVLTELTTDDGNFLVSLNVGKDQDIDFNIVATVFGKGSEKIVDWFNKGYATYIDKEKALNYLHHSAPIAEALSNPRLISTTKVIQNFENPKIEPKNSLRVRDDRHFSMPMPDDIFFDDNGDIVSFGKDDVREATTIVRRAPKTTEERIKTYMQSRHYDSQRVSSGSFI